MRKQYIIGLGLKQPGANDDNDSEYGSDSHPRSILRSSVLIAHTPRNVPVEWKYGSKEIVEIVLFSFWTPTGEGANKRTPHFYGVCYIYNGLEIHVGHQ